MSKLKLRFFTIADFEDEEKWLRRQHSEGLRLVKSFPPCFYIFEECAPEDVIYRLAYKNSCPDSGYLQLFADCGWEYVSSSTGWLVFRKPAAEMQTENDGNIFSDDESKLDMISGVVKTRLIPLLIIFLCCVIPNWVRTVIGTAGTVEIVLAVVFTLLLLLYSALLFHCVRKLSRLRDRYPRQ